MSAHDAAAVHIMAITGGPGAGKSTLLIAIQQKVADWGFNAFVASEAATELIREGILLKSAVREKRIKEIREYQKMIMERQKHKQDILLLAAQMEAVRTGKPAVVIADRGFPDNESYFPQDNVGRLMYAEILREVTGFTPHEARDFYRSGALFLQTPAGRFNECYTCENNAARDESPELARELDDRTFNAWNGHPHLGIVESFADFADKKKKAMQMLCRFLGIPEPLEIERKFLVRFPCFAHFPVPLTKTAIAQTYLHVTSAADEVRVRCRMSGGGSTYYYTEKKEKGPGVRSEFEKSISWREYVDLLDCADSGSGTLFKDRYTFRFDNQYCELDVLNNVKDGALCILEIEQTSEQQDLKLPPFLEVEKEVTDDPAYKNRNLARRTRAA